MLRNTRRVEEAMSPILRSIQDLSRGSYQPLDERGELAEISAGLNRAGDYLMQKDNTRVEWIAGYPTTSELPSPWYWATPASWRMTALSPRRPGNRPG